MDSSKAILLVEDNPLDEALTIRALRRGGVDAGVVVAHDGAEALDYVFARGAWLGQSRRLPNVILLDLALPRVDGHEVLRQLRSAPLTRTIPVIVLTTSTDERDISRSYLLGANGYLAKLIDFDAFVESLRRFGLYWLGVNLAPSSAH